MIKRIVLLVALLSLLSACGTRTEPEEQLRQAIAAMEEAAEAGRRGDFMDHVSDDFGGQGGRVDRDRLNEMFRVQLLKHTRVSAVISNVEVTLHGDRATLTCNALLTGGPRAWFPDTGRLVRFNTGWRLEGGDWQLISADWEDGI